MYQNSTGPGDYESPGFAERMYGDPDATKRTYPAYTFGPKTTQPYFPQYEVDFKGRDSPALSKYHPKMQTTKVEHPQYSIKREARFSGVEQRNRDFLKNM